MHKMSNKEMAKNETAETETPVIIEGEAGNPVGIEGAHTALVESYGIRMDTRATDVATVTTLVANNPKISKAKIFESLETAFGGKEAMREVISSASLYRYATIGAFITSKGLPITSATFKAVYPLTEGGNTEAFKAIKAQADLSEATLAEAVEAAIEANKKASTPAVESGTATGAGSTGAEEVEVETTPPAKQTPAAWLKSLEEDMGSRDWTAAEWRKISTGLRKAADKIEAVNPVPASK